MSLMNPQQPGAPTPQAPQPGQYDFIMNNAPQQKPSRVNLPTGNSTLQRVLIMGGGLILLLFVGMFVMSFLGGSDRSVELTTLVQNQTEIVRIADAATSERTVRLTTTKNLASNVSISVSGSLIETTGLIKGKKLDGKTLGLKKSAKTDTLLASAAANNRYDEVFVETITDKLKDYQSELKTLYDSSKSSKEKDIIKKAYDGATILLSQKTTP